MRAVRLAQERLCARAALLDALRCWCAAVAPPLRASWPITSDRVVGICRGVRTRTLRVAARGARPRGHSQPLCAPARPSHAAQHNATGEIASGGSAYAGGSKKSAATLGSSAPGLSVPVVRPRARRSRAVNSHAARWAATGATRPRRAAGLVDVRGAIRPHAQPNRPSSPSSPNAWKDHGEPASAEVAAHLVVERKPRLPIGPNCTESRSRPAEMSRTGNPRRAWREPWCSRSRRASSCARNSRHSVHRGGSRSSRWPPARPRAQARRGRGSRGWRR